MKPLTVLLLGCLLACSCGDLSEKCIQVQQLHLCYYPDELTEEEANGYGTVLATQGFAADCKLVSKKALLVDVDITNRAKTESILQRLADTISVKMKTPFKISVVAGLEGKSSLSVHSK